MDQIFKFDNLTVTAEQPIQVVVDCPDPELNEALVGFGDYLSGLDEVTELFAEYESSEEVLGHLMIHLEAEGYDEDVADTCLITNVINVDVDDNLLTIVLITQIDDTDDDVDAPDGSGEESDWD